VMFESNEDQHNRINDDVLDIDVSCVMVLKYVGPKGYPGMAEVGNMPLPPKILKKGITDMIRISDGRMSGTAYGTVVLHVAPESAAGGPLALVQNGDRITLDVPARRLHLDVDEAELSTSRAYGARLREAVCRPRTAGESRRRPRLPGRLQRFARPARQPLNRRPDLKVTSNRPTATLKGLA
jgi:dihydroxyacid dehydratase/phosphogluconate dehydratase